MESSSILPNHFCGVNLRVQVYFDKGIQLAVDLSSIDFSDGRRIIINDTTPIRDIIDVFIHAMRNQTFYTQFVCFYYKMKFGDGFAVMQANQLNELRVGSLGEWS